MMNKMIYTNYPAFYRFLVKLCVTIELKYQKLKLSLHVFKKIYLPEFYIINSFVLKFLYERWRHLFTVKNQQRFSLSNL